MTNLITTASISIKNLSKHFDSVKAVDDVNLEVEAGTLVCLLGPSGCGKTTTLRMIAGFEDPTSAPVIDRLEHQRLKNQDYGAFHFRLAFHPRIHYTGHCTAFKKPKHRSANLR